MRTKDDYNDDHTRPYDYSWQMRTTLQGTRVPYGTYTPFVQMYGGAFLTQMRAAPDHDDDNYHDHHHDYHHDYHHHHNHHHHHNYHYHYSHHNYHHHHHHYHHHYHYNDKYSNRSC